VLARESAGRQTYRFAGSVREKILQYEATFARMERPAARKTGQLPLAHHRRRFDFDQLIQRLAVRTVERRRRKDIRHAANLGAEPALLNRELG
jgi:hypothetical protein